jgi:hypothetical protein
MGDAGLGVLVLNNQLVADDIEETCAEIGLTICHQNVIKPCPQNLWITLWENLWKSPQPVVMTLFFFLRTNMMQ